MLEYLSKRELSELDEACARNEAWARVIRLAFDDGGGRLRLGLDRARTEEEIVAEAGIAPDATREACHRAGRWCQARGLHLMGFPDEGTGSSWTYLMAVG